MRRNILYILAFLIFLTESFTFAVDSKIDRLTSKDKLSLVISLNQEIYKIGDGFEITGNFKNISGKPLRILPWMLPYTTQNLKVCDKKGAALKKLWLIRKSLRLVPKEEDFVLLPPGKSYTRVFEGRIKKESLRGLNEPSALQGVFIRFRDSAFFLEGDKGEYIIQACYQSDKYAIERGMTLFGFTDVWQGEIKSNEVKFTITK